MKKLTLVFILACCMLNVAAQDSFKVNYQGARPMGVMQSRWLYKNLQHAIVH